MNPALYFRLTAADGELGAMKLELPADVKGVLAVLWQTYEKVEEIDREEYRLLCAEIDRADAAHA